MVLQNFNPFKCVSHVTVAVSIHNIKEILFGRWYMTTNQIAYYNATEGARHNLATENETHRSNVKQEELTAERNAIERDNANTSKWKTALSALFGG